MARKTSTSKAAAADTKRSAAATKQAVLRALSKCLHEVAQKNNDKLPYGHMQSYVKENRRLYDWVTRDALNSAYTRYKKDLLGKAPVSQVEISIGSKSSGTISSLSQSLSFGSDGAVVIERKKGGRPVGTTDENKQKKVDNIIAMKNDITLEYKRLKDKGEKLKRGQLKHLIEKHKLKRHLEDVHVPLTTIRKRVVRNKMIVMNAQNGGHTSPLASIDDVVVNIILMMARVRQCLSPSKGLSLVNSLIKDQPLQQDLINWKQKYSHGVDGKVGPAYWRAFMKRNRSRIVSKRGQKYTLDRQKWTTYANFLDMYYHCINEMVDAGIAEKYDEPKWLNMNGEECSEAEALGCKVTHKLCHPELCFVGDEVGGNLSMKGDGHAGGQKFLTGTGTVPYRKCSNSEKRFTLIGLTALDGQPVMCVLILKGNRRNLSVETGIDITVIPDGQEDNNSFFFVNTGPGKYFPGPPTCTFRGKEIPALVRWNESGSITSQILVEMLQTLDMLGVIPREENIKPFLLLDGHGSRLEVPFLQYINTPTDHWVVCIGVPYGTALWQVGDSKEQNGSFNIAMNQAKQDLLSYKEEKCMEGTLLPTDLMPLINKAWSKSFARVDKNKKAIAERGWNPLNFNLLLNPEIRATMTKEEIENEASSNSITLPSSLSQSNPSPNEDPSLTITDSSITTVSTFQPSLNFDTGTSAFCLDAILKQQQLQTARERIKSEKDTGDTMATRLRSAKRVTAGICFNSGTARLGIDVFQICKDNEEKKANEMREKQKDEEREYLRLDKMAKEILSSGKDIKKLTNKELYTIIKSLRRKDDKGPLPTKKADMIELFEKWKERPPPVYKCGDDSMRSNNKDYDMEITQEAIV